MTALSQSDPDAFSILQAERHRQHSTLELIASENHASAAVLEASPGGEEYAKKARDYAMQIRGEVINEEVELNRKLHN